MERSERGAGDACLVDPKLLKFGERLETLEHGVVERNIGLDRFAQDHFLECGGAGEQTHRGGDEGNGLIVPETSVDIQLFEVRDGGQSLQLVLESETPLRDTCEVESVEAEIGGGQVRFPPPHS